VVLSIVAGIGLIVGASILYTKVIKPRQEAARRRMIEERFPGERPDETDHRTVELSMLQ